jgi:hypothetical protein
VAANTRRHTISATVTTATDRAPGSRAARGAPLTHGDIARYTCVRALLRAWRRTWTRRPGLVTGRARPARYVLCDERWNAGRRRITMSTSPAERLRERIRGEYLEMPGLRLTIDQMHRLCAIDRSVCLLVLEALVDEQFLCETSGGAYARATDGTMPRPRAAKATVRPSRGEEKAS